MRRMTKTFSSLLEMSRRRAIALAFTAITGSLVVVPAKAGQSMKRADFEMVFAGVTVSDDCFLEEAYLASVWDDELIRARIKQSRYTAELGWLWLTVQCFPLEEGNNRYVYDIDADWTWKNSIGWAEAPLSGAYGIGTGESLKNVMREQVSRAITKYLEENL